MPLDPYQFIRVKREGGVNNPKDIKEFVEGHLSGEVADCQFSAWLMAVCFEGLSDDELHAYTEALIHSGERIDLSSVPGFKVDKHSTGGVGDKVSLVLAPLVAACGVAVPMVSGRGLGHTGGTLDKLASIPGFRTDLSAREFKDNLSRIGVAMMGQTAGMCPADGKIYALRDVTATVESIPLIAASIASKKIAEGAQGLVLDVKVGSGAFMRSVEDAQALARAIINVTKRFRVKTTALLTDMNQPLGKTVGNALEVREALDCLKGEGPSDLRKVVLSLAARMLSLAGQGDRSKTREIAQAKLDSGKGLEKFRQMVERQGGDPGIITDYSLLPKAQEKIEVKAEKEGYLQSVHSYEIGMLAVQLGAGRRRKEDEIDPEVGFEISKKIGDSIKKGEVLAVVHARDESRGKQIACKLFGCFEIGGEKSQPPELITKGIT